MMLLPTRLFGVTASDADRYPREEPAYIQEIAERILLLQSNAAARQRRALARATHAKGVAARAKFEILDVTAGRDAALAARLAKGIFASPGIYPATIRFANSDAHIHSDLKADTRSLSVAVDLTRGGTTMPATGAARQDFSLQNARTLPLNDARAFLASMKVSTASNAIKGLWSLGLQDKLRVLRTFVMTQMQSGQPLKPYQQYRYWSAVPFRHGPDDIVKQCATPSPRNPAHPLQDHNSDALCHEFVRHLVEDDMMGSFDLGLQFLDIDKMTYWGKRRDTSFWIENASVAWKESQAPFHTVARLTFLPGGQLSQHESDAAYFDVTSNTTPDSAPVGSINRARRPGEVASRRARPGTNGGAPKASASLAEAEPSHSPSMERPSI
jgi:hypothetical protein